MQAFLHTFPAPSSRAAFGLLAVAGATLLAGLTPSAAEAQPVQLRYQFTDGMDVRYEMDQNTSMALPGGMGNMDQGQKQVMRLQVLSVDAEGNARIRSTVESIRMEIEGPMGNQVYDSSDDAAPSDPALRPVAALVGTSSEVVVSAEGRVVDVGDLSESMAAMLEDLSPEERAMIEETFNEETMANLASQSFQVLPEGSVSVGDSWEHSISIPMPFGTLNSTYVYTLDGVDIRDGAEVARIGIAGRMGGLELDESNPIASMISFDGGAIEGSAEFDVAAGRFLSSTLRTSMRMGMMGETLTSITEVDTRLVR